MSTTTIPPRARARMLQLASNKLEDTLLDLKFHLHRGGPPPMFVARRCAVAVDDVRKAILEIVLSEPEDVRFPRPEDVGGEVPR